MPLRHWLETLPTDVANRLRAEAVRSTYSDEALIQLRGDHAPALSIIVSGSVRFGTTGVSGAFIQFAVLSAGDVYGEMTVLNGSPRLYDGLAVGPVVIDHIAGDRALAIIEDCPLLQMALLRIISKRLQFAYENIDAIIRSPLVDRISGQLLLLSRLSQSGTVLQLRQSELAESLGASRVAVNKALAQLTAMGFISTGYGTVTVNNRSSLRAWVDARRDVARLSSG